MVKLGHRGKLKEHHNRSRVLRSQVEGPRESSSDSVDSGTNDAYRSSRAAEIILEGYGFSQQEKEELLKPSYGQLDRTALIKWAYIVANSFGLTCAEVRTPESTRRFFRELVGYSATGEFRTGQSIGILPTERPQLLVPLEVSGSQALVPFLDLEDLVRSVGKKVLAARHGHERLIRMGYTPYSINGGTTVYYRA